MKVSDLSHKEKNDFITVLERALSKKDNPCKVINHKCLYYSDGKISIPKQIKGGTLLSLSTTSFDCIRDALLQFKMKDKFLQVGGMKHNFDKSYDRYGMHHLKHYTETGKETFISEKNIDKIYQKNINNLIFTGLRADFYNKCLLYHMTLIKNGGAVNPDGQSDWNVMMSDLKNLARSHIGLKEKIEKLKIPSIKLADNVIRYARRFR